MWQTSVQKPTPLHWKPVGQEPLQTEMIVVLYAETAQSALAVIFKLVISGLTHVILIVLCTLVFSYRTHLFAFLEAITQKCGSLCHEYILVIM